MEYPEEVPLVIPCPLKQHLEDDCYWIVRRGKLVRLPSECSVTDLLKSYYHHSIQTNSVEINLSMLAEVLDGLKICFDFMLPDQLLYSQEKPQFKTLTEERNIGRATTVNRIPHAQPTLPKTTTTNDVSKSLTDTPTHTLPSDVYGVEHFLRLFVRLPMILSKAHLPINHVNTLHTYFKDLLDYLSEERSLFSESHYYDESTGCRSNGLDNSVQALSNESVVNNIEQ